MVGHAPEGDTLYLGLVAAIDVEEGHVAVVEVFLSYAVEPVAVGVHLLLISEILAHLGTAEVVGIGQQVEVELGDVDFHPVGEERVHGGLILGQFGIVYPIVALHAHGVDAQALDLERVDKLAHGLALAGLGHGVVVVVELGVGVGLMGKLERLLDVVGADDAQIGSLAQGAVVLECLVHHVPAVDLSLVATHHGADVLVHAVEERLAGEGLALVVGEEPGGGLRVPHQGMAHDLEAVVVAPLHQAVGLGEVVLAGLRCQHLLLHTVLGHHRVEVLQHHLLRQRVGAAHLVGVHGHAHEEILSEHALEGGRLRFRHPLAAREEGCQGGGEKEYLFHTDGLFMRCDGAQSPC